MRERSLWLRERQPRNPYLLDGFLAVALGTVVTIAFFLAPQTPEFPREPDVPGVAFIVAACGALVFRRRAPVAVFAIALLASTVSYVAGYPDTGAGFAGLIALYTVASRCDRRVTLVAVAVTLVGNAVAVLLVEPEAPLATVVGGTAMIGVSAAWGDRKQVREAYFEQLELRAAEKERERIEAAQRAVGAERARIARELHDVVAHAMSVVAVQSGVGAHVIEARPEAAKRILETISDTSRDALSEMRRLLGVLRSDPDAADDLTPAPGLAGLDDLVARVSDAGIPVELRVEGEPLALPAGVDLAAYRIVQEALTNVLKHAGPARATVAVRYGDEGVRLVVIDDGRGAAPVASGPHAPGHGIVGMRERAELYGGSLAAGPRPGGGFRVTAMLRHDTPVGAE